MSFPTARPRRTLVPAVLFLAGVLGACDTTPGTHAPLEPETSALFGMSAQEKHDEEQRKAKLEARLDGEKERIKAAKEESKEREKQLKADWKAWKKEWSEARKQAKKEGRTLAVELLRCEPQGYDAETKAIGPDGGDLKMGPHQLVIPKGALTEEVVITAEAPVTDVVEVRFEPHGLVFQKSPVLKLDYGHCMVPDNDPTRHQIVYLGTGETILEYLDSSDNKHWDQVLAEIDHFSKYALAIP